MDELEILIQAILSLKDTTKSKQQILSELPKLQQQLQSDKNARVNIVAGLDVNKSKSLIQSQLNNLTSQTKAPNIKVGVDVLQSNASRSITNELKNIQTQASQTKNSVKDISTAITSMKQLDDVINNVNTHFSNLGGKDYLGSFKNQVTEVKQALLNIGSVDLLKQFNDFIPKTINVETLKNVLGHILNINEGFYTTGEAVKNINSLIDGQFKQSFSKIDEIGYKSLDELRKALIKFTSSTGIEQTNGKDFFTWMNENLQKSKLNIINVGNGYAKLQAMLRNLDTHNSNGISYSSTLDLDTLTIRLDTLKKVQREENNAYKESIKLQNALKNIGADDNGSFLTVSLSQLQSLVSEFPQLQVYIDEINQKMGIMSNNTQNIGTFGNVNSVREYNQELRETNAIQSQMSNRNYASDNSKFIQDIKTLKDKKTAVNDLVKAFDEYGITVKNATSTNIIDDKGQISGLRIDIQSATGEIEKFKYLTKEANGQTVLMLQNITATDNAVQRLVQSQTQYNDRLNASATKLQSQLDNVKNSAYIGSKPIDFGANEKLTQQYNNAVAAIEKLKTADKTTMASMQANANAEISTLRQMIAEVRNAEYAATQLRSKDIGTIKNIQTGNLDKFINQINNSKVPMEALKQDIDNLKVSLSSISKENPKSLTDFLNQLDIAKSKFASLKEFYKSIGKHNSELEKMAAAWKRQGVYTDELKSKISALKNELKQVAESGNTAELTAWVENYKKALSGMNVDSEKQAQLNNYLNEQVRLTKTILSLQIQIATVNPNRDENKLSGLRQALSARQQELSVLRQENSSMTELMSAEQQQKFIIEQTSREQERLLIAQQRAADIERRSEAITQKKADNLRAQISAYEAINTKAAKAYSNEFASIKKDLDLAKTPEQIEQIRAKFTSLKSEIKVAGKEGQTFFQKMAEGAKKFAGWMSLTTIISYIIRDIRKMLSTVVELDTALVDLRKTFKGTDADLKEFYYDANDVAKQLGVTTAEVINQASAWSRLNNVGLLYGNI